MSDALTDRRSESTYRCSICENQKYMDDFFNFEKRICYSCNSAKIKASDTVVGTYLRGYILEEARKTISVERQDSYGNPEDSFTHIANYWNTFLTSKLKEPLTKQDAMMMMVLFKIAREHNQHKKDNLVDAAGYLGILGDCYKED